MEYCVNQQPTELFKDNADNAVVAAQAAALPVVRECRRPPGNLSTDFVFDKIRRSERRQSGPGGSLGLKR